MRCGASSGDDSSGSVRPPWLKGECEGTGQDPCRVVRCKNHADPLYTTLLRPYDRGVDKIVGRGRAIWLVSPRCPGVRA